MNTQQNSIGEQSSSFTPVDSVSSIVDDLRAAGYAVTDLGCGFNADMTDDEYATFMVARGYVRDDA
jgi:hypothetical protein